jgi:DNA mismatch endonuclease (patch repair protein)
VDGAFWHGHPSKYWPGRSSPYWDAKIAKNVDRDKRVNEDLKELGWKVVRIWDFEIEKDVDQCARRLMSEIRRATRKSTRD